MAFWILLPAAGVSVVAGLLNVGIAYIQENPSTPPAMVLRPAEDVITGLIGGMSTPFDDAPLAGGYSAFGDEELEEYHNGGTHRTSGLTPIDSLSLDIERERSSQARSESPANEFDHTDEFDDNNDDDDNSLDFVNVHLEIVRPDSEHSDTAIPSLSR